VFRSNATYIWLHRIATPQPNDAHESTPERVMVVTMQDVIHHIEGFADRIRLNRKRSRNKEGGLMNTQVERPTERAYIDHHGGAFGYLAAGLGIGAALSIFFAPKSGEETRKWIAGKCLNAVDTANEKVRVTRTHVKEFMDRGQEQVSAVVAARREAIRKTN
jgi:YtxH-like protein